MTGALAPISYLVEKTFPRQAKQTFRYTSLFMSSSQSLDQKVL